MRSLQRLGMQEPFVAQSMHFWRRLLDDFLLLSRQHTLMMSEQVNGILDNALLENSGWIRGNV